MYVEDFKREASKAGFTDPRQLSPASPINITDAGLLKVVGNARFYSITYRLFKLPGLLETLCEDYGQIAIYKVWACGLSAGSQSRMLCARLGI